MPEEWFASWFNSRYYPLLYQHRDDSEAEAFLTRLLEELNPSQSDKILDLACGRGRHAIFLAKKGYDVTGLDLSPESIADAAKTQLPNLNFAVHDMRLPMKGKFNFILNLFTSFGYFNHEEINQLVLKHISDALQPKGIFVLDYLNVGWVKSGLVPEEEIIRSSVTFNIRREISGGFILKKIEIIDGKERYQFQEKVQALEKKNIEQSGRDSGLNPFLVWGDYEGNPWHPTDSPRLIIFFKKSND